MESPLEVNVAAGMGREDQAINEALSQWNLARTNLAAALQTYLDTFSHFELVCSRLFDSKEHDASRPDVRAAINDETLSFAPRKSSIISTGRQLMRLRNLSMSTSPISALPVEVLGRIFTFNVESCGICDAGIRRSELLVRQVNAISSVCSYWRSVALHARRLWTRIDFERLHHSKYLDLWLERAGNSLLDVLNGAQFNHPELDDVRNSRFCLLLPRIKNARSMVLRSRAEPMKEWISSWYATATPGTLTTLALSAPWDEVEFPLQGGNIKQERLTELLHSIDTLHLSSLDVHWDSMRCQSLVTLSLRDVIIGVNTLGRILTANPNLQHLQLTELVIKHTSNLPLPVIQLHRLRTLVLESLSSDYLAMIAPGNGGLTLKMEYGSYNHRNDASRRIFIAFCERTYIAELHSHSRHVLQDAIITGSKIEVLYLSNMTLDNTIYDLIVPPTNDDSGSSREQLQSRLPHLHSLYVCGVRLKHPEGFRRVLSACPIREVGMGRPCSADGKALSGIDNFRDWVGPGVSASFVSKEREAGYAPFDG
ncbi:hypothetical protein BDV93DRAFT_560460 [Ceratobasidium sp. AG-I]|nr:hypothetical protein BDV93DRAFT_560460 [Ceratobasidium sp. AG-I]